MFGPVGIIINTKPRRKLVWKTLNRPVNEVIHFAFGADAEFARIEDGDGNVGPVAAVTRKGGLGSANPLGAKVLLAHSHESEPLTWVGGDMMIATVGEDGRFGAPSLMQREEVRLSQFGWGLGTRVLMRRTLFDDPFITTQGEGDTRLRLRDVLHEAKGECLHWWQNLQVLMPDQAEPLGNLIALQPTLAHESGHRAVLSGETVVRIFGPLRVEDLMTLLTDYCRFAEPFIYRFLPRLIEGSSLDPQNPALGDAFEQAFSDCPTCQKGWTREWEELEPEHGYCPDCGAATERCEFCDLYFPWESMHDRAIQPHCEYCHRRTEFWKPVRDFVRDSA